MTGISSQQRPSFSTSRRMRTWPRSQRALARPAPVTTSPLIEGVYGVAFMHVDVIFETHSTTEDNENGIATGWNAGRLSFAGRKQATQLGARRRDDGLSAIFTSDLERALETVRIAFDAIDVPVLHDWRLRECNYGLMNGTSVTELRRVDHIDAPYPSGETWREAITRVGGFLQDLERWNDRRVLVIGHTATRWALDHFVDGRPIEELVSAPFSWREGWEYRHRGRPTG
jgi:2,3-bisphosphoglycerate-dependent phosphoglycerate mutase